MPLYYKYFTQPYTGNYIDYTFDIAPLNDFEIPNYEVDTSAVRQGFDYLDTAIGFGFANIPTGLLKVIDQDNDQGIAYIKNFPTGEFEDWKNNDQYVAEYDEDTGLVGSSLEDMLKTFILDPEVSQLDAYQEIDFITWFTGVNSRLYDQDNNFVFSYSNKMQGPISIHGNIFQYYQNYSINSLPVNSKMRRGCSDKFHISGFFFTHPDFKFTISARGHVTETPWTPEYINNKIWLHESGLFPNTEDGRYYAQWIPSVSSGVFEEGAEGVFDLVSGNRTASFSSTPLMYSDKITENIQDFIKDSACKNISYLESKNIANTAFWKAEDISFPLLDDGYRATNIGIAMVLKISEEFENIHSFPFNDGFELMYFGSIGLSSSFSIMVDENQEEYAFRLKFKSTEQSLASSPYIKKGDYNYHMLHWTYDLSSASARGWVDTEFLALDSINHGGSVFPENTDMIFQKMQGLEIAEIIIYPQAHRVGQYYDKNKVYFIDGYLSHKWNLNVLPSDHPYYHGYPAVLKAGMAGGPLEDLYNARVANLLHF